MQKYSYIYQQLNTPETYELKYDSESGNIFIGANYNLSEHSFEEIVSDLTGAGFDSFTAHTLAEAAHKTGTGAQNWVEQNRFFTISDQQHQNLFEYVVLPDYEENLSYQLHEFYQTYQVYLPDRLINLSENQKQILFDFVSKDNLINHSQLTIAVINEDWDTVKAELALFDTQSVYKSSSEQLLNEFFSDSSAKLFSDENQIIELRIPTNYDFTYNQEIGHQGQSLIPHFPGGKSGVTIGPGYDMSQRTPEEIYQDLTAAGIDPETVQMLMGAAHKSGGEAQHWVHSHHNIHITEEQQRFLFYHILVPEYEERTQQQLQLYVESHPEIDPTIADWDNLSDKQKQMLFDFTYNIGLGKFPTFVNAVLEEDWDKAYQSFERRSAGELLTYRNESFYDEFLEENLHHHYISENNDDDNNNLPDNPHFGI